jgi:hypothetical protein
MTTSKDILAGLALKHDKDLFVPECKTGPTVCTRHFRMDAWAMKKSWAHPEYTCYEIKVSKGDFVSDSKWTNYLPYCNRLYFVCPAKLISVDEVPDGAGLMWCTTTGKVYVKKRTPYRDIDDNKLNDVFKYILMSRTAIGNEHQSDNLQFWRNWLVEKKINYSLGYQVSKALRHKIETEILDVKHKNENLEAKMSSLQQMKDFLIATFGCGYMEEIRGRIEALINGEAGVEIIKAVCDMVDEAQELTYKISKIRRMLSKRQSMKVHNPDDVLAEDDDSE